MIGLVRKAREVRRHIQAALYEIRAQQNLVSAYDALRETESTKALLSNSLRQLGRLEDQAKDFAEAIGEHLPLPRAERR